MKSKFAKVFLFLKELPFFLGGLFCISYIFYVRVILERLPSNLKQNLYLNGNYFQLVFYGFLSLLFFYAIIKNTGFILNLPNKTNKLLALLSTMLDRSYASLDYFIKNILFKKQIGTWITHLGLFCYKHLQGNKNYIIIAMLIIPRFIVLLAFFLDVCVFHKFNYVYKFSILLLIPLIVTYLEFLLDKFWKDNTPILEGILFFYDSTTKKRVFIHEFVFSHLGMRDYQYISKNDLVYGLTDKYVALQGNNPFSVEKTLKHHMFTLNDILIPISVYSILYTQFYKNRTLPVLNLVINILYCFIWTYVLIYSW